MLPRLKLTDCNGETIRQIMQNYDTLILRFDDGWFAVKAEPDGCDNAYLCDGHIKDGDLMFAGVLTEEELKERMAAKDAAREANDRALYERLKAKFATKGA